VELELPAEFSQLGAESADMAGFALLSSLDREARHRLGGADNRKEQHKHTQA
jgi:hypothetical protein